MAPRSLFSPFLFKESSKVLVAMLRYDAVVDGIEQGFYRHNRRELCRAYLGKTGHFPCDDPLIDSYTIERAE